MPADVAHAAISAGFVYAAFILDAWSWEIVGYAISCSIDVRLPQATLHMAVENEERRPADLAQFAAGSQLQALAEHGLVGSTGQRGNSCDTPRPSAS
ncbi:hypothetical protein [Bosea sp. (in: a-proteobacteria)]|uniref:hypothetical protein n=1 Tax=Bosea sp. (in: a-proteobacteria) TaxID=1871050 RepID=UPI0025BCE858|nr:hypothetical protein [Bosea sp. (in: a-proteobacteria)]